MELFRSGYSLIILSRQIPLCTETPTATITSTWAKRRVAGQAAAAFTHCSLTAQQHQAQVISTLTPVKPPSAPWLSGILTQQDPNSVQWDPNFSGILT